MAKQVLEQEVEPRQDKELEELKRGLRERARAIAEREKGLDRRERKLAQHERLLGRKHRWGYVAAAGPEGTERMPVYTANRRYDLERGTTEEEIQASLAGVLQSSGAEQARSVE